MGLQGDSARCRDLAIDAYLAKPIRASDLLETIQRLVAREAGASQHVIVETSQQSLQAPHLSILVAEDNPVNQLLARRVLEKQGHLVTVAGNGRLALEAFEQTPFDLILMDVQMPEMDGFEAARAIRQQEALRSMRARIPILAVTAHAMKGDRERCLAAGMDGFVSKPIQLGELLEAIAVLRQDHTKEAEEALIGSDPG
jgi:CheY-like chemotaxis protein